MKIIKLKKVEIFTKFAWAFLPTFIVCIIDLISKKWITSNNYAITLGPLHFEKIFNHGILFGISSDLPISLKIVLLTTLGAIFTSLFLIIILFIPIKSNYLKLGLSLLTGGIIANVIDRIVYNAVIDFITIKTQLLSLNIPYFNLADIFQWIGILFVIYGIYIDSKFYWPNLELRNNYFINPKFQIRSSLTMGLLGTVNSLIIFSFGISFLISTKKNENIKYYIFFGLLLCIFLSFCAFIVGLILSHRVAGPIYAINRYLNESINGKNYPLKLRENDEFKELEVQLTKLNIEINRLYIIEKKYNEVTSNNFDYYIKNNNEK